MNPSAMFCPQAQCPLRGLKGQGNIVVHSLKEARYGCLTCGDTFAATVKADMKMPKSPK